MKLANTPDVDRKDFAEPLEHELIELPITNLHHEGFHAFPHRGTQGTEPESTVEEHVGRAQSVSNPMEGSSSQA